MKRNRYTYIPNSEIESITTWNGKEIQGSKLLDGAYARGKVQYGEGGEIDVESIKQGDKIESISGEQYYVADPYFSDKYFWVTKDYKQRFDDRAEGYTLLKSDVVEIVERPDEYDDYAKGGKMMAKGGDVKMGDDYKIVIKKTNSPSNYNVFASLFRKGEKNALIGTTFKDTATNTEIKEWFEKRIGMMADGGKTGQTDFMKLYNLASEKQRLRNSLQNASPDRKKEILKKIDEVNAKMDQMGKSMGYADGGSIAEGNNQMLMSKIKEVKHHADELGHIVKPKTEVEDWVVAKAERSASDLSDITHYIDGNKK
jgi:hypothetical protein